MGGEERVPFAGNIVPDVFDPNDPLSVRQALEFCNSVFGCSPLSVGSQTAGSQRRDLETRIRRALDTGEIAVISETFKKGFQYKVASDTTPRAAGAVWRVYGAGIAFLIVRRGDLLPGERPLEGPEVRDVIESLILPEAQSTAAAILASVQSVGPDGSSRPRSAPEEGVKGLSGGPTALPGRRSRLHAAFRSGALVLVALKHDAGAASPGAATDDLARAGRARRASTKLHWIEFRVIDVTTGKAVPDIQLEVTLADGSKPIRKTNAAGVIRFDGTTAGDCALGSDLKDVRLEDAYAFVAVESD